MRQAFAEAFARRHEPELAVQDLKDYLAKEYEGWQVTKTKGITYALPRLPDRVTQQVPEYMRDDIQRFMQRPHVKIGRKWYVLEPSFFPDQDFWEANTEELVHYTVQRRKEDFDYEMCPDCREFDDECERHTNWPKPHTPGREPREMWVSETWFERLILAICGRFRQDRLVL